MEIPIGAFYHSRKDFLGGKHCGLWNAMPPKNTRDWINRMEKKRVKGEDCIQ